MYTIYGLTDIGRVRLNNEDNIYYEHNNHNDYLVMLLDGMGGHNKGDVAAKLALDCISKAFLKRKSSFKNENDMKKWAKENVKKAHKYILQNAANNKDSDGMGTTIVGVLMSKERYVYFNAGDSRLYSFDGDLRQITIDETYANYLLKNGELTKKEYDAYERKNVLINALGAKQGFEVTSEVISNPFTSLFLCSDGLYNMVKDDKIKEVLISHTNVENKINKLVKMANDNGGRDNISAILIEVI